MVTIIAKDVRKAEVFQWNPNLLLVAFFLENVMILPEVSGA